MTTCAKCKQAIEDGEEMLHNSLVLCDDCYLDAVLPRVRKMYYENEPSEFMRRLKDSYSMHPQRYH